MMIFLLHRPVVLDFVNCCELSVYTISSVSSDVFSISCLTANIASVIPLHGMNPNCSSPIVVSSLRLLSIILSQVFIVCDINCIPL